MSDKGDTPLFSLGTLLFVISLLYGGAVKLREIFYKKGIFRSEKLPCTVISVGNITVGGTGKTPVTIYVARLLNRLGYKAAVISRGYKGEAEKTGGVVSNGETVYMDAGTAGDEPFMMASRLKSVPVVVGQNRFEAGMTAVRKFKPDVIVLDDAFQHLRLRRDTDLVLLDSDKPFGNKHLVPRGLLREHVSALLRGDAYIMTRSSEDSDSRSFLKLKSFAQGKPVFRTFHVPLVYKLVKESPLVPKVLRGDRGNEKTDYLQNLLLSDAEFLKGCNIFAFSGIAKNDDFQRTIESFECNISGFMKFPDHHQYSDDDLHQIFSSAKNANAYYILTTEKDYVRIAHRITWGTDLVVIGIDISFGDNEEVFSRFIKDHLKERKNEQADNKG